jgi:hypothetical protein
MKIVMMGKNIPMEILLVMGYYWYYCHLINDDVRVDYEELFEVARTDDGMKTV